MLAKNRKIFISGPSGTGKTTLAKWASEKYDIPLIKGTARQLYEEYGFKNHEDEIRFSIETPGGIGFQFELLEKRFKALKECDEFIIDRSLIDNAVYFMLQCSAIAGESTCHKYIHNVKTYMEELGGLVIYLPMSFDKVEDDGIRIPNIYYQKMVDTMFNSMITANGLNLKNVNFLTINSPSQGLRHKQISDYIKKYYE